MSNQENSRASRTCPYLGLIDDPNTNTDFPYVGNACHRIKPPITVVLDYQESCCLSISHRKCPGYVNGWKNGFPKSLRGKRTARMQLSWKRWYWYIIIGAIILFLFGSYAGFFPWSGLNFMSNLQGVLGPAPTSSATMPPTRTKTSTVTLTNTSEPTFTNTLTKTKTPTKTQTPTETPTSTNTTRPYTPPTNTKPPAPQPTNPPPTATSRPRPPNPQPPNPQPPTPTNTPDYKP